MQSGFRGFSDETMSFLTDLGANNNKAWFDANRARYDDHLLAEAKSFVIAAGDALAEICPGVRAEPRVNRSIFRINRDTRFSKDKTPYKDHLDFWFWDSSDRASAVTGYFLRISAESVDVGVGAHRFDRDQLAQYRALVVNPVKGKALREAVATTSKAGFAIQGEHYRRPPKGFDEPTDPMTSALLRHNALWAGQNFAQPASLRSSRFTSWCLTRWRKQQPLHDWLVANMQ